MTLMKFLNESTDEEFAEELDDYVDTESFAKYLGTQEILSNNDAMDGPDHRGAIHGLVVGPESSAIRNARRYAAGHRNWHRYRYRRHRHYR